MNEWVAVSGIVRNLALALAGFVGAYLAWRQLSPVRLQARSAAAQADLARRTHVIELFDGAAGQLSDPKREVRPAAIYVLRGIAKDLPDPVFELMQAYLRAADIDYGDDPPPVDIRAIQDLLRRRLEVPRV